MLGRELAVSAIEVVHDYGDGLPELGVGAMFDDDGSTDGGAIYVLFLNPPNAPPVVAAGAAAALLLYPGLLPWRPLPGVSVLDVAGAVLLAIVAFAPGRRSPAMTA